MDITASWPGSRRCVTPTLLRCTPGHAFGETAELAASLPQLSVEKADLTSGEYRGITGAEALALGIAAAGELADRPVMFCSYPITPSPPLLHRLIRLQELGVGTFQAEDEIAAICAAIGASYGGMIGVTSSSGPGIALKTEAMGLAVIAELPLDHRQLATRRTVDRIADQDGAVRPLPGRLRTQRQTRRFLCWPLLRSEDCFAMAIEAVRIALRHMTPVILLADGYLSNAAEPWKIPDVSSIPRIDQVMRYRRRLAI